MKPVHFFEELAMRLATQYESTDGQARTLLARALAAAALANDQLAGWRITPLYEKENIDTMVEGTPFDLTQPQRVRDTSEVLALFVENG